ncbi:ComF family protein [Butyrivibrio proteoclasticus]|uniref:ComF family protein n=1 Tax=Butyrivibrio proteoclasticus TaxID=43305 RepID=UPI0005530A04|nr:ComF family protein [Butyrivibrio proteoclasticus]
MFKAVDLIYPRRCPVCDGIIAPFRFKEGHIITGDLIHGQCLPKIKRVKGSVCLKCGKPLKREEQDEEYCVDCKKYRHVFERGFSLFVYRSVAGSIYRFKYLGRQEYAEFYARVAAKSYGKRLKKLGIEAIIPVPMYAGKERKRGYNQAQVLAKALSKELGIECYDNVIKRVVNTRPMKELDAIGRRNNLKKAFNIAQNDVKFKCILIIDDIYTTGSTIDEIAHEFLMAGVEKAYFLTLAIGQTT